MPGADSGAANSAPGGTVREATWSLLRSFGIDRVFGNPGSTEMRMLSGLPAEIEYVLGLQEATVVAMADGYAQRTRNAAFASLHSAAGLGHALGSVLAAHRNQTPLIVTAGQQTRAMLPYEPFLHADEAAEFPKPYVKWSVEPARAADVPVALARAYHTAMMPPRGPVFVSIPEDDWEETPEPVFPRRLAYSLGADPEAIADFADRLVRAERPALVVGPGVDGDGAGDAAVALAERMRAGVYVAPWSSRCSFPERHPLFQGFIRASRDAVVEQLAGHDVVLVVGAQAFTYHAHAGGPFLPEGASVLHMTDNPRQVFSAVAGDGLVCSPKRGIEALLDSLPQATRVPPEPVSRPRAPEPAEPLAAETVLETLSGLLDEHTPVYEEATSYRRALRQHLPIAKPGNFYNAFSGGLGWALPAAVGGAIAGPERRTVCIIGDGSSMYSVQALWTAAQHRVPLTVIVLNNGEYGALKGFVRRFGGEGFPGADLPGLDLVSEAAGLGCEASRVESAPRLRADLRRALASPTPYLLDVTVAPVSDDPL